MDGDARNKTSWLTRKLEDPEFRLGFDQETASDQFCDALELAMEREGLSRADLAKRLGRSRASITKSLTRGRNLTIKTMVELLTACGHRLEITARQRGERRTVQVTKVRCPQVQWEPSNVVPIAAAPWDEGGILFADQAAGPYYLPAGPPVQFSAEEIVEDRSRWMAGESHDRTSQMGKDDWVLSS